MQHIRVDFCKILKALFVVAECLLKATLFSLDIPKIFEEQTVSQDAEFSIFEVLFIRSLGFFEIPVCIIESVHIKITLSSDDLWNTEVQILRVFSENVFEDVE